MEILVEKRWRTPKIKTDAGEDITHLVRALDIRMRPGEVNTATIGVDITAIKINNAQLVINGIECDDEIKEALKRYFYK